MRPRRGTELHGRKLFIFQVFAGTVCVVAQFGRLLTAEPSPWLVISAAMLTLVGAYSIWNGGFMLEWWGPPEPPR